MVAIYKKDVRAKASLNSIVGIGNLPRKRFQIKYIEIALRKMPKTKGTKERILPLTQKNGCKLFLGFACLNCPNISLFIVVIKTPNLRV
jgi:hypothetical protein